MGVEISPRKTPHPEDSEDPVPAKKPKKNRCSACKKKVGLTGFDCRCGGLFCSIHRYSDKHDCSFDCQALRQIPAESSVNYVNGPPQQSDYTTKCKNKHFPCCVGIKSDEMSQLLQNMITR